MEIGRTFLNYLFLGLEGECDENNDSDFEILLHFKVAIVSRVAGRRKILDSTKLKN